MTHVCLQCGKVLDTTETPCRCKERASGSLQRMVRPFVFLHIYDERTGHMLRGHWRTPHVRRIADTVLKWIDEAHAANEVQDYEI